MGSSHLAFFHMQDHQGWPLVLDLAELTHTLDSLQLVGHNNKIYEIWRNRNGAKLHPWSHTKAKYRTAADFGSNDWEWLLASHQLERV